ncbi:LysR family transcriptional regulator [Pigmentiphaga litoralis]|uniref:LysR family transcriptional regulator n=1 Tax=Pigmentiphaga litoralis TaxID=516702 RepID=UPI003B42E9BA
MDTRYVQSFITVVECGSLAEAARRLDLTPAAIAARVKALEEDLGVALVKRAGRNVKATEAGLKVMERARQVLREVRDLHAAATDDTPLGEFRLGASTSALIGLLPPVLRRVYDTHPKLAIYVEPGTSRDLYHRTTAGDLDATLIVEPQFAIPKEYEWRLLAEEPLVVLAPAHLADHDAHAVMASEPFIRYDRSVWGGRMADRYLRQHGIRPHERLEIDGLMAISSMVAQGLGVSLVPDWAPAWLDTLPLVKLRLPDPAPVRRMGLLWAGRAPHAQLARVFYACAQAQLELPG